MKTSSNRYYVFYYLVIALAPLSPPDVDGTPIQIETTLSTNPRCDVSKYKTSEHTPNNCCHTYQRSLNTDKKPLTRTNTGLAYTVSQGKTFALGMKSL